MKNGLLSRILVGGMVAAMLIGCSTPANTETENNTQTESTQNDTTVADTESEVAGTTETPEAESQKAEVEGNWTELTAEEVAWFNDSFFNQEDNRIVNYFLNSEYEDVKGISIFELFRDINASGSELEAAEKEKVSEFGLDISKSTTSYINEVLGKYAKTSLEETNKVEIDSLTYLEEYDAYYYECGDTHYQRFTMNTGYKNKDGLVKLFYVSGETGETFEVTLMQTEDGYVFVSNVKDTK